MVNDKLEKVKAEIKRLRKDVKDNITELGNSESERIGLFKDLEIYDNILSFIDSLQEEPKSKCKGCNNVKGCITCVDGSEYAHIEECNITGIKSKHATGKLKELVDNISEEGLKEAHKQLEELTKECMYSKDNYTDEDRKVLCDGCEEECEFNKKDEIKSVHAQHTTISSSLNDYLCKAYSALYKGNGGRLSFARLQNMAIDITEWQKEHIIKRLCNHANIDQMAEKFEDKYKPEKVLDTEYYKRGIFDTIKAIKED